MRIAIHLGFCLFIVDVLWDILFNYYYKKIILAQGNPCTNSVRNKHSDHASTASRSHQDLQEHKLFSLSLVC